jgi:hypothetical protein
MSISDNIISLAVISLCFYEACGQNYSRRGRIFIDYFKFVETKGKYTFKQYTVSFLQLEMLTLNSLFFGKVKSKRIKKNFFEYYSIS